MNRRRVDWSELRIAQTHQPQFEDGTVTFDLGSLLSAMEEMLACADIDEALHLAVSVARERIGLVRVGVFLRDEDHRVMRGTWGTDLKGATVDEHDVIYAMWEGDKETQEAAWRQGTYWTVVNDAPIIVHTPQDTRVVGHGWVCCTPIRSDSEILGTLFNDPGLTGVPLDNAKQSRVAMFCSLIGTAIESLKRSGSISPKDNSRVLSSTAMKVKHLLKTDPSMTGSEIGERLRLSASRIARVFKAEAGISLVDYRNQLRLERFYMLLDQQGGNLMAAALAAGFGSYGQFHRVFLAVNGTTPGQFAQLRTSEKYGKSPRQK